MIHHGGHGDRRNRCDQVDLDHSAEADEHNDDGQDMHGHAHDHGLEPQADQAGKLHGHQRFLKSLCDKLDIRIAHDHAGGVVHYRLRNVEHRHNDIPCVGHDQNGAGRLEHPHENRPGVEIMHVVLIHDDADEFHGHDQRQNDTGYGQDHVVGKVLNHTEDSAVPALRGLTDLHRNISDLRIHRVHHPCQVGCNRSGKKLLEPFGQRVEQ